MQDLDCKASLDNLGQYSLLHRRERRKILENHVLNLTLPIYSHTFDRRGHFCIINYVKVSCLGSLMYSSFRWKATSFFNCLPMYIRNSSSCSTIVFKKWLDKTIQLLHTKVTAWEYYLFLWRLPRGDLADN